MNSRVSRMLREPINRLLARAARKRDSVFGGSYRAATARERSPDGIFQHPVRTHLPLVALLLLAAALNRNAFLGWFQSDDLDNISWASFIGAHDFWQMLLSPTYHSGTFRPIGHYLYRLVEHAGGLQFSNFVATLQAFHLLNIVLLWMLLRKLSLSGLSVLLGTAFFALHPAAFYAWWRPMYIFDVTCATLILLSTLMWIRRSWVFSFLLFVLAYRAKEVAVALPVILLGYELLLGGRRWKPVLPFFFVSLWFGVQAVLANRGSADSYTLQATPAVFWQCLQFYSTRLLLPYSLLLLPLGVWLMKDRRGWWGLSFFLLLVPMLLLPMRLEGMYLYPSLLGGAILAAALAGVQRKAAIAAGAIGFVVAMAALHRHERVELHAARLNRDYVNVLAGALKETPELRNFVYTDRPTTLEHWGITGALTYLIRKAGGKTDKLEVQSAGEVDPATYSWPLPSAMLIWREAAGKVEVLRHPGPSGYRSYLTIDRAMPLWQIQKGWRTPDDDGRWVEGHAEARLFRPAGATRFEIVAAVKAPVASAVKHRLEVTIAGLKLEPREFAAWGAAAFRWKLPAADAGEVPVLIDIAPETFYGSDPKSYSLKIQALGFK